MSDRRQYRKWFTHCDTAQEVGVTRHEAGASGRLGSTSIDT